MIYVVKYEIFNIFILIIIIIACAVKLSSKGPIFFYKRGLKKIVNYSIYINLDLW